MIVTCTQCHAKFRVADEKVGPRGAKVRCSRCHTVFLIQRGSAAAPPPKPAVAAPPAPRPRIDLDLETGARPVAGADPFAPAAALADPYAQSTQRRTDPFAAGSGVAPPPSGAADPLGADPFGPVTEPPLTAVPGIGPSVPGLGDPFVAAVLPRAVRPEPRNALVMDPSDLARPSPAAAAPGEPEVPPGSAFAIADPARHADPLALEDRTPGPPSAGPPPLPPRPPPLPIPGSAGLADDDPLGPGVAGPGAEDGDQVAGGGLPGVWPGLPDEPFGPAASSPPAPAQAPAVPTPAAPVRPAVAARPSLEPERDSEADRRRRTATAADRIRAVAVNAVALVALLVLSLGLLLVWRGRAPLEAATLRPAALLDALGGRNDGPFRTEGVTNGLYERAHGEPLLFVRGRVVSHASAAVHRVRVSVELLRGASVIARGEALAGATPTPEELWSAGDGADLARIAREAAARAPRAIRPGDEVPFLVVISDTPTDLSGATLRLVAAPVESANQGAR